MNAAHTRRESAFSSANGYLAAGAGILLLPDLPAKALAGISVAALAPLLGLALLQARVRSIKPVGKWMYPIYPIHLLLLSSLSLAWL